MTSAIDDKKCNFCKDAIFNGTYVTADNNIFHKICAEEMFGRGIAKAAEQDYPVSKFCRFKVKHTCHFSCLKNRMEFFKQSTSGKAGWLSAEFQTFMKGLSKHGLTEDERFEFMRLYKLLRPDINKDVDYLIATGHLGYFDE